MQSLKENLSFYLANFYAQDFILLGLCFLIFIIILIVSIFLRRFATFSLMLIIFGVIFEFAFYYYGNQYIIENYRPNKIEFVKNYKLLYSDNIYINFKLHNLSNRDFKTCKVVFKLQKPSKNHLEFIKNSLKPLKVIKITIKDIESQKFETAELLIPSKVKKYKIYPNITCF